jgi:periplasmic protein CpxP/Spy
MSFAPRRALLAALLASAALATQAQPAPPGGAMPMHPGMQQHMQERMQEHMQRRLEKFKHILQITPAQEPAFNAWAAAMLPSQQAMQQRRALHEEMGKLTTPERIDRMRQLRTERNAAMDRRFDATKTFYAQLSPSQQKAFDEVSMRFLGGHHGRGHGGHDRHHGLGA